MASRILPVACLLALAACGSSVPPMIRVHGLYASDPFTGHAICTDLMLEGAHVTITDASGTILATATLPGKPAPATIGGTRLDTSPTPPWCPRSAATGSRSPGRRRSA